MKTCWEVAAESHYQDTGRTLGHLDKLRAAKICRCLPRSPTTVSSHQCSQLSWMNWSRHYRSALWWYLWPSEMCSSTSTLLHPCSWLRHVGSLKLRRAWSIVNNSPVVVWIMSKVETTRLQYGPERRPPVTYQWRCPQRAQKPKQIANIKEWMEVGIDKESRDWIMATIGLGQSTASFSITHERFCAVCDAEFRTRRIISRYPPNPPRAPPYVPLCL